jgi:hypothetical protein
MQKVIDCNKIKNEDEETFEIKVLLCKISKNLGFEVNIDEAQEIELGKPAIRHDVFL